MRKTPPPPDFDREGWQLKYCSEFYWDPKTQDTEKVRLVAPIPVAQRRVQKRLAKFFYVKAYKYIRPDGTVGGISMRPLNQAEVIRLWGLVGDEDNWVEAILINGSWRVLERGQYHTFDFLKSEDSRKLEELYLYLGEELLHTFRP